MSYNNSDNKSRVELPSCFSQFEFGCLKCKTCEHQNQCFIKKLSKILAKISAIIIAEFFYPGLINTLLRIEIEKQLKEIKKNEGE